MTNVGAKISASVSPYTVYNFSQFIELQRIDSAQRLQEWVYSQVTAYFWRRYSGN